MKHKLKHAHKTHSFIWWSIIILTIIFAGFLFIVSLGYIDFYQDSMVYFSPEFFILTLAATIAMSYNKAYVKGGDHQVGPFLTSVLFAILTQFVFFLLSPYMDWSSQLNTISIIKMTIFFILPSIIAFILLKTIVCREGFDDKEDYSWFDGNYYLNWMELMANIMTLVTFFSLFVDTNQDLELMGVRGTIWAFYSIVARFVGDHLFKEERYGN